MSSPNNTEIIPGSGSITDATGTVWNVDSGQRVDMNGNPDPNTANVIEMAYVNDTVWQENSDHLWWSWNPSASDNYNGWAPSSGTATSPLPTPVIVPTPTTLTWTGGAGNHSAVDPNNWSPSQVPVPGDTLDMSNGTIDINGNQLAGDTLSFAPSPGQVGPFDATVNLSDAGMSAHIGNQSFGLNAQGNTVSVELSAGNGVGLHSTVAMPFASLEVVGQIGFIYGLTVRAAPDSLLTNNGEITLTNATIDSNMNGGGIYDLERYHDGPGNVTLAGKVGGSLVFNMEGEQQGFASNLTVDQPHYFQGQVNVQATTPTGSPGADVLNLKSLTATSYDIKPDLLTLYNGNSVVDTVQLNSALPFSVAQHGGDVSVYFGGVHPDPSAVVLPVHT